MTEAFGPVRDRLWRPTFPAGIEGRLVFATLLYFVARLVYLAIHIAPTVPPDETTHVGRIEAYADTWLIPADSAATFEHGPIRHQPFLYDLLMGKLLTLNVLPVSDLVFLRLVNAALSLLTAIYAYRWIALVTDHRPVRLLFLVILTNTLMVTALGAAVSYDNLVNLLAAIAIYHLFAFFVRPGHRPLAAIALSTAAGCLTKTTFLPLAAILLGVLLARERAALPDLLRHPRSWLSTPGRPALVLYGLVALAIGLNAALYGGNLLRYGRLVPGFSQVVGVDNAMRNRIFARHHIVRQYREGRLTYDDAVAQTAMIRHPGDRADALLLLAAARDDRTARVRLDRLLYAATWAHQMLLNTIGYAGHIRLVPGPRSSYVYAFILTIAAALAVRTWRPGELDGHTACAAGIGLAYAIILMWLVNYPAYLRTGIVGLGLQGRYLFPVAVPLWGLVAHYLLASAPRAAQAPIGFVVGGWFVYGDLPFFLSHASAEWFASP